MGVEIWVNKSAASLNPKFEYRNPKQIQMTKFQKPKQLTGCLVNYGGLGRCTNSTKSTNPTNTIF